MRAGIGLVGVLIAIGVLVYFMGPGGGIDQHAAVLKQGEKTRVEANQMAGRGADGKPVAQTLVLEPQSGAGKITSILVASIDDDSPLKIGYGLKRNDSIVEIGPISVRELVTSAADADAFITDAYSRKQPIFVKRDGRRVELTFAAGPNRPGTPSAKPTSPAGGIHGQLDAIQKAPTH